MSTPVPTHTPKPAPKKRRSTAGIVILAVLFLLVGIACFGTYFAQKVAQQQAKKHVDRAIAQIKDKAAVQYSSVKINLWTRAFYLNNLKVVPAGKSDPIEIDRIVVWNIDWDTLVAIAKTRKPVVPRTVSIAVDGVKLPTSYIGTEGTLALQTLGYQGLKFDTQIGLNLDLPKKNFGIEEMSFALDGIGAFSLSIFVSGLDFKALMAARNSTLPLPERLKVLEGAKLNSLALRYEDDTLVKRGIDWFIKSGEAPPVQLLDLAIEVALSSKKRKIASQGDSFHLAALKELRKFIEDPDGISIQARPPFPVPFLSLLDDRRGGSIDELAAKLHLTVQAD